MANLPEPLPGLAPEEGGAFFPEPVGQFAANPETKYRFLRDWFMELPDKEPSSLDPRHGVMMLPSPDGGEAFFGFRCGAEHLRAAWPEHCRPMAPAAVDARVPTDSDDYGNEGLVLVCFPPISESAALAQVEGLLA